MLNKYIVSELGDLSGKSIIHLQCNTGADTILLAKMGASAMGVDIVPDNILYAKKLAEDFGVANASFIESDIMELMAKHGEKYDVVFVSEGAIGWLPDLKKWAQTIRHLLKDDGFFYIFENHPIYSSFTLRSPFDCAENRVNHADFRLANGQRKLQTLYMMFDEGKLAKGETAIKYPYFKTAPDVDESIGGYASESKGGVKTYFWQYKISDVINSLVMAGLKIEFFNEFVENFFDPGGCERVGDGLYNYPFNGNLFPMSFSLRAEGGFL